MILMSLSMACFRNISIRLNASDIWKEKVLAIVSDNASNMNKGRRFAL